LVAYTW